MKLLIPIDEFNDSVAELAANGSRLKMSIENSSSLDDYNISIKKKEDWLKECTDFFSRSFTEDISNYFSTVFRKSGGIKYIFKLNELPRKISAFKESMTGYIIALNGIAHVLPFSDAIINPQIVIDEKRGTWTIQQKKSFLLSRLNDLGQTSNYDLEYLYWANGLIQKNHNEAYQIGRMLVDRGYIDMHSGTMACITIDGISHVEENTYGEKEIESVHVTNNASDDDIIIINDKLDRLEELMNLNNYGNEIIFEELQELKNARGTLNPKNWTQLAKGKLFDLMQGATDDKAKDTIKEMFNSLLEEGAKLLF